MSFEGTPLGVVLEFPYRLRKEAAGNFRGHWSVKHTQTKQARKAIWVSLTPALAGLPRRLELPLLIDCIRIAPSFLDRDENLPMAFKSMKDQISEQLGFNDRDKRAVWTYGQFRPRETFAILHGQPRRLNHAPAFRYHALIGIQEARCRHCGGVFAGHSGPGAQPIRLEDYQLSWIGEAPTRFVHSVCWVERARTR